MIPLERIKERKLVQWGLAYLAGAWLLLQVLDVLATPFDLPDLLFQAATVLLAVGLLAVLVVAWYHGEKGRQKVSGMELLMLSGILLIAGVAVTLLGRGGQVPPVELASSGSAVPAARASASAAPEQGSIAVLPFADMSAARDQEYFTDGLTEELLNALAQLPELRVAARTSAFAFKGKDVGIDSIARALRVSHVLEGSVRKAGDQVRITAQLIDAGTGYHLWSETFDSELSNIFTVQDEISRAIVDALQIRLVGSRPRALVERETASPEAHTLVLRGIAANRQATRESVAEAEDHFREAIRLDPGYARAYSYLANALMLRAYLRDMPVGDGYAEARVMAERALALDPTQSEAHATLARIAEVRDWDFAAAEEHFRRAIEANPNDGRSRSLRAWLLVRLGRTEEALAEARRSVELDPVSFAAYNNLGATHLYSGQSEEALGAFQAAAALAPESGTVRANLAVTYAVAERLEDAVRSAEQAGALEPASRQFTLSVLAYAYARAGRRAEAERELAALRALPDASPYLVATVYAGLGDAERAFEFLERAVDQRDGSVPDLGVDPVFDGLRNDPRMDRLLERIGLR